MNRYGYSYTNWRTAYGAIGCNEEKKPSLLSRMLSARFSVAELICGTAGVAVICVLAAIFVASPVLGLVFMKAFTPALLIVLMGARR